MHSRYVHTMRLLFILLLMLTSSSFALECRPVHVQIEFKPQQPSAPIRQDVKAKELTEYANKTGSHEQGPHATVGLYQSNSRLEVMAEVESNPKITCIQQLNLVYSFNQAIQIAKEFASSTCLYRETVVHEREHERIHRDYTQAALQGWSNQVHQKILQFQNPSAANDWLSLAKNHLATHLKNTVEPMQVAHDSPEEYEKLGRFCGHEMRYMGLAR